MTGLENYYVIKIKPMQCPMAVFLILIAFSISIPNSQAQQITNHFFKGELLLKQGDVGGAISEYEREIKKNPHLIEVYLVLGNIYRNTLKNNRKAIEVYRTGLQKDSASFELTLGAMYSYFDMGDIEIGIGYYETAGKININNKSYFFPRETLDVLFAKIDRSQIRQFCEKYLIINPTDGILREKLVAIYIDGKEYQKAENELEKMLDDNDKSGFAYFNLGTCAYNLGDYEKSLEYFLKAKKVGEYVPEEFIDKLHELLSRENK